MNTHVGILSYKAVLLTHVQESGCIFEVDFEKAQLRTAQEGLPIRLASPLQVCCLKKACRLPFGSMCTSHMRVLLDLANT